MKINAEELISTIRNTAFDAGWRVVAAKYNLRPMVAEALFSTKLSAMMENVDDDGCIDTEVLTEKYCNSLQFKNKEKWKLAWPNQLYIEDDHEREAWLLDAFLSQ